MGAIGSFRKTSSMASRWRRRRMCVLITNHPSPAALREISANRAFLETNTRPDLGSLVELHHPDAGAISGTVRSLAHDGIEIVFTCSEQSVAFAIAAITSDMSRPAV